MIAFIDCFINDPVNHCVNHFIQQNNVPATYHMPSVYGMKSLKDAKNSISKIIILGSASHTYQKLTWHKELLDFVIPLLESGIPTLGICFGHQLIAEYYGATIDFIKEYNQDTNPLTEVRELTFTKDKFQFNQGESISLAYAHSQIITKLPNSMSAFLVSTQFEFEGVIHNAYPYTGVQAHPESLKDFICESCHIKQENEYLSILNDGQKLLLNFIKS